jgi:hypothetical protein
MWRCGLRLFYATCILSTLSSLLYSTYFSSGQNQSTLCFKPLQTRHSRVYKIRSNLVYSFHFDRSIMYAVQQCISLSFGTGLGLGEDSNSGRNVPPLSGTVLVVPSEMNRIIIDVKLD